MKINKKYWLMPMIMILTILFLSNCYADAECEHKNRFILTRDNSNHFFRCSDCKYDWAESHNIGEGIDYTWDFDNQTCTAKGRCTVCALWVSETAAATANVIQEKNCTLPELTTYSVTFGNSAFGTQTKENVQTAEATGHSYGAVTYTWSADNQKCTAERKCTVCDDVESETADATAMVVQEKSCTLPGLTTYSVTFGNSAFGSQTKENVQTAEATGHDLEKKEKKEASCTEAGYETYWKCNICEKLFSDEAGTVEISNPKEIKATGHNLEKVAQKDASCTEAGYEAYWRCQTCGKLFSDEKGTKEINNPIEIKATGHDLKAVKRKEAGCTEAGYEAYWRCQTCKKLFSDEAGTVEIINPKEIKATGHNL